MESELRKLYKASFKSAVDKANAVGVSKRGRKKFISDNTSHTYHDCKCNPKLKKYILDKYGK